MSEPIQDKRVRFQEGRVGEHYGQSIGLKGLQLPLSELVILVIGIERSVQRSRIGENGPRLRSGFIRR